MTTPPKALQAVPLQAVLLAACLLASFPASAISAIDCRRASEGPERLVCGSPRLMAAERGLDSVYAAARQHASRTRELERSQRAWMAATPSRCKTKACLTKAYANRVEQLAASYSDWCASRAGELQHDWRGDARAFFEELSIGAGTFESWSHRRPDTSGSWSADGCLLVLHGQPEGLDFRWVLLDVGPRRLRVFDLDDLQVAVYHRGAG